MTLVPSKKHFVLVFMIKWIILTFILIIEINAILSSSTMAVIKWFASLRMDLGQ